MRPFGILFTLISCFGSFGQNQIPITRVSQMSDLPVPYHMRDWKAVARQYDSLIFSQANTGDYMPMLSLGSAGVNYPEVQPIFMDSYVGSVSHGQQQEAINILPALVGATLTGADKTSQFSKNWVEKAKDFYNLKNGELVYLNGPSSHTGNDWWYETMPNVFFYQLHDLYPGTVGFEEQFFSVADRWLEAVEAMGGSATPWTLPQMTYRSWDLNKMQPGPDGVKEPEAAGAIAWILYNAYNHSGDKKYLVGAQWTLDYLNSLTSNPSYELQLSYGVLTAARMNAEIGTNYDIDKMINWCFSRGDLRGWGSVVGNWSGYDVSGLIGEANDQGNDYVFLMNGFQQVAALAPLVKYDKRYAASIAKWILNVSNASRLFYSKYLPETQQSDFQWCSANDPNSVIAYEAIKENWQGTGLFARGDSKDAGWAATNLGLYGSSHVGYLGAVVEKTNIEGILLLDLNATDFYSEKVFSSYLLYNPYEETKQVQIDIGSDSKDIYEAIRETIILENVSGTIQVTIEAGEALLLSYTPAGSSPVENDGRLVIDNHVLDYHYGYDFEPSLRIKSLATVSDSIEIGISSKVFCTPDGASQAIFQWYLNDLLQPGSDPDFTWIPSESGEVEVKVEVSENVRVVKDSLMLQVVELIPRKPILDTLYANSLWVFPDSVFWVNATVHDPRDLDLSVEWSVENGIILEQSDTKVKVQALATGLTDITFTASNYAEETKSTLSVLVTEHTTDSGPLVYLPLNGISTDQSGNQFETHLQGGNFAVDPLGNQDHAIYIGSPSDELIVSNTPALNFEDAISISLWAYFTDFSEERFIISHGSWDNRWKVSTTTEKKLRWTVNTTDGIKDLDATPALEKNTWYHVAVVYSGTSMQIYLNGALNAFVVHTGKINTSNVDLCVGKRLPGDTHYYLKGRVDEVGIYDLALGPDEISELPTKWWEAPVLGIDGSKATFYPNPASNTLYLRTTDPGEVIIRDIAGNQAAKLHVTQLSKDLFQVDIPDFSQGIYLLTFNSISHKLIIR